MIIVLILFLSYLIGSISFAIIFGFVLKKVDIRTLGSGNAGATNVKRVLGWRIGSIVMILDFFKSFIPILLIGKLELSLDIEIIRILMLLCLIIGHVYPIFFSFKGGKGVATAAGGITALFPPAFPFCLVIFIITILLTRYVSVASLITAWTLPIYYFIYTIIDKGTRSTPILLFFIIVTILITIFHKKNIIRLFNREESKITSSP
ncbi:glycerol-3-phosphate 1-O-acyltransferase [Thiospirochaeta perfilievii]|uniref:Glycerol-3-phosphate acyltransferase n=1 Tax=Thiospirochaeta perfilievii TaxID=252967 RepID=A0A5C1QAZ1_9SPIO|nr:glycerol-3-phosphate 1-O-acyltransferase PlsY [Thiospirochaeta perfilievii]QEN05293.1 glycerol-3-phosphate 1-O-acyltransferase [Thiospirochaeta perfilievii]